MYFDQSQIQALYEHCHVMGTLDLFSRSFPKLYHLLADDRDWQPGELRAANRYAQKVLKPQCPKTRKTKSLDDLGCFDNGTCVWGWCSLRHTIRD